MPTARARPALPDRLPHPGPSYLKEQELRLGDRVLHAGMSRPVTAEGWWLAVFWIADEEGIISFRDLAPVAGPPPEPPLFRLGPVLAGALSGMILEEDGRLAIRLTPFSPPENDAQPWRCPLAVRAGFRFEPALAATMTPNQLANQVLDAFRRAVASIRRA